jgi:RNA polymerase sigma-70 factor (ECF subfamily)
MNVCPKGGLIVVVRHDTVAGATEGRVDRSLVELAQRGDRDAFAGLVHAVSGRLYALAYRILRDPDSAQDAFQDALLSAWRRLPTLRDPDRFEAWVHRILVHACYAESKRQTRFAANIRVLDVDGRTWPDLGISLHDRDELERGFRLLPLEQRAVFVLHHHVGLPLVEIADLLGIPAGTARSRLHYATQALRTALADHEPIATAKERLA